MGQLSFFDIKKIKQQFNLKDFVETGTHTGEGVWVAINNGFDNIYSVELLGNYYIPTKEMFKNYPNVKLYHGLSTDKLPEILTNNLDNTLFWLDAHLPNLYDTQKFNNNYKENQKVLIPLEEELKIITTHKTIINDYFIIDDLRIYEHGPFVDGEWRKVIDAGIYGIDFIFDLLSKTHNIEKLYDDQGYIVCTPKVGALC